MFNQSLIVHFVGLCSFLVGLYLVTTSPPIRPSSMRPGVIETNTDSIPNHPKDDHNSNLSNRAVSPSLESLSSPRKASNGTLSRPVSSIDSLQEKSKCSRSLTVFLKGFFPPAWIESFCDGFRKNKKRPRDFSRPFEVNQ